MSPLISIQQKIAALKTRIAACPPEDTELHEILEAQLKSLRREHSRISSNIPIPQHMRGATKFDSWNKVKRISIEATPIKCGLRNAGKTMPGTPDEPWCWNNLTQRQTLAFEKVKAELLSVFKILPEDHILRLVAMSGGATKALKKTGCDGFSALPDFIREAQGKNLLKIFTNKLLS